MPRKIPEERLIYVEKLYLEAWSGVDIQRKTTRKFGIKPRQARLYFALVQKRLGERFQPQPESSKVRAEGMLLEAYRLAKRHAKDDPRALTSMAVAAVRLAELNGVMGPKRLELSGPNNTPLQHQHSIREITPEEALAFVNGSCVVGSTEEGGDPEADGSMPSVPGDQKTSR